MAHDVLREAALRSAIEAKERELAVLYERQRNSTAAPRQTARTVTYTARRPYELQIRGPLRQTPQQTTSSAAQVTPPLGDLGPPESVAFPITAERRRLSLQLPTRIAGVEDADALAAVRPAWDATACATSEFETRLSRLRGASVRSTTAPPPPPQCFLSPSLSPIGAHGATRQGDVSCASFLADAADFFASRSDADETWEADCSTANRHVRSSSKSPQVATFSVERPCPPGPAGHQTLESGENHMPTSHSPCVDHHSAVLAAPRQTATPPASPRASVASYLSQLEELRTSLQPRSSGSAGAAKPPQVPPPPCAARGAERDQGAAMSLKELLGLEDARGLSGPVSVAAAAADEELPQSLALRCASPLADALASFSDSSPIFLRRREHRRDAPTHAAVPAAASPVLRDVTNSGGAGTRPGTVSQKRGSSTPRKAVKKKCVRFCESVVQRAKAQVASSDPFSAGAATSGGASARRARPQRRGAATPAAGVPIAAPAELRHCQAGLGAGIVLPCGPTLYFE